jgi:hypothetical protein
MRTPRLTCISDGNPFRRLLIVSKKWLFVEVLDCHDDAPPLRMSDVTARDTTVSQRFGDLFRKLMVVTDHLQQR